MGFVGTKNLTKLLNNSDIIAPFNDARIKNGSYELSLGSQVFQTDSAPRTVKNLKENDQIEIKPGQFALLLTNEYIKVPGDKIAFISIKAGIKFKGLVNVSGFHVDPGFEGKLLFSVYNAGSYTIVLSSGTPYFPIWFAQLDEAQEYKGNHQKQTRIPDDPIEALSQGELASPNILSKKIDEIRYLKTKIEWAVLAILTLSIGLSVKFWTDANKLKEAVDFGYNKKIEQEISDSIHSKMLSDFAILNHKVDSLMKVSKEYEEHKQSDNGKK